MSEFNLAAFENVDSGTFTVLDQSGDELLYEGKPVTVTVHAAGSKVQVAADRKRLKAAKQVLYAGIGGRVAKDAEEQEFQREAEYLATCTIAFENFPVEPLVVYRNPRMGWFTRQVTKFISDDQNFKPGSRGN